MLRYPGGRINAQHITTYSQVLRYGCMVQFLPASLAL